MDKIVLSNIEGGYNLSKINDNFDKIEIALNDKVLYRDNPAGTTNTVKSDIDVNNKILYNLPSPTINSQAVPLSYINTLFIEGAKSIIWKGMWSTSTEYLINNAIEYNGSSYICILGHTSTTFNNDLSNGYWEILAKAGSDGTGSGDMIGANNLSELTNVVTARSNLGLGSAALNNSNDFLKPSDINVSIQPWVVPGTSGNILTSNGSSWTSTVPPTELPSPTGNSGTVLTTNGTLVSWGSSVKINTAIATTSGTSIDFTGIPSWVKRITFNMHNVSTNGTSTLLLQLGTSSGVQTSAYSCAYAYVGGTNSVAGFNTTIGFAMFNDNSADFRSGSLVLTLIDAASGTWAANGLSGWSNRIYVIPTAGSKTLTGTLDRIRLTTATGTDSFDSGSVNILWE